MTPEAEAVTGRGRLPAHLVGAVVGLTPSAIARWTGCRRRYLLADLLQLPGADGGPTPQEGLLVHALLKRLHETGGCTEDRHRQELAEAYAPAQPERLQAFFERHALRCPRGAATLGHERELARFHRAPAPAFVVGGRIDAIWVHDGLLDARDYKTGAPHLDRVGDDVVARAYAWLLAPLARERGLRLRVRYEILAEGVAEDPDPFEPDDEQLAAIEDELRTIAEEIRGETEYRGISDPMACGFCVYRSVCVDAYDAPVAPPP